MYKNGSGSEKRKYTRHSILFLIFSTNWLTTENNKELQIIIFTSFHDKDSLKSNLTGTV
jgi:hypothetical protein